MAASEKPGQVPPEVLRFLAARKARPSFSYKDVWAEEHAAAFAVAKATEQNIVNLFREHVQKALEGGLPYEQFARNITPILQEAGWWGRKEMVDPETGDKSTVQLGSPARLRLIIQTNTRTARAAGQWSRIERSKAVLPFLRYRQGSAARHRPDHEAIANRPTVLPVDHPYWNYAAPPNGWGCVCWLEQITRSAREKLPDTPEPDMTPIEVRNTRTGKVSTTIRGVDPMFAYNAGKDRFAGLRAAGIKVQKPREPKRDLPSSRLGEHAETVFGRKLADRELDALFAKDALPAGFEYFDTGIRENEGRVRLDAKIKHTQSGRYAGSFSRNFTRKNNRVQVEHSSLFVADEFQSTGVGKSIFNAQIDAYKQQRIGLVTLSAGWVGKYVWTKAGFDWITKGQFKRVLRKLKRRVAQKFGEGAAESVSDLKTPQDIARFQVGDERVGKDFLVELEGKDDFIEMSQIPSKIRKL